MPYQLKSINSISKPNLFLERSFIDLNNMFTSLVYFHKVMNKKTCKSKTDIHVNFVLYIFV